MFSIFKSFFCCTISSTYKNLEEKHLERVFTSEEIDFETLFLAFAESIIDELIHNMKNESIEKENIQ